SIYNASNSTYLCAVREYDHKWVFIPEAQNTEYILYDFDVEIGDTVIVNNPWESETELIVFRIDSTLLLNKYHKTIDLGHWDGPSGEASITENWIEGIGSTKGLIYSGIYVFDYAHSLICFHENDTLVYMNSPDNSCGYIHISSRPNTNNFQLKFFPNPTLNNLYIETKLDCLTEIYDLSGVKKIRSKEHTIDVSNLEPGLYIIQCKSENGYTLKAEKLIISTSHL
ncbi:MAG: T9SS type A sorting domain-containing protein, partial [Bacteroidales bacterium]|nr:T9SS type A sorting domain-containing protein [Bacteroidales bacterium]